MGKIDMTGWIMKEHGVPNSKLTVLYETSKRQKGSIIWHCKCECGNECDINGAQLRNGNSKTCGYCYKKIDMTGWVMKEHGVPDSRLTVLYELPKRASNGSFIWHCKCECGNECDINGSRLRNGRTKSCGCYQRQEGIKRLKIAAKQKLIDLTGQDFGYWHVIEQAENQNGRTAWLCQCKCGTKKIIAGCCLKDGSSQSCGCLNMSHGEKKIKDLLEQNNINFIQEYSIADLWFTNKANKARFDFYVENKYAIEFDGVQHFQLTKFNNISEEKAQNQLKYTQEHDKLKNQYCFEHNIPIIRIPYTHLNNICLEDLIPETSQFLLKQEE